MSLSSELKELADRKRAALLQRFFKTGPGQYGEGDVFLGISVPVLRRLAREHRGLSEEEILKHLGSAFHEERFVALLILIDRFEKGGPEQKKRVYELYLGNTRHINNWDLVDVTAYKIIGEHLLNGDRKKLYELAASRSLWERRMAIISTFRFIRDNDFHDALRIAGILLRDGEELIHKAVGWMLREVGKRDSRIEEEFLLLHYKDMPRTMLRYAIEKFPEEKRLKFLKGEA